MATTAHGLVYPEDYTDKADVPTTLAAMVNSIESALVEQDQERATLITQFQAAGPVGMIVAYGGTAAPTGWKLCDGSAHGQGSNSAIQTVLGSANVPDLRNRFVVSTGSNYTRGATGGADLVTLTAEQSGVAGHTHPGSSSSDLTDHTHSGTTGYMTGNNTHKHTAWSGYESANHLHYTEMAGGSHGHGQAYQQNFLDQVDSAGTGAWTTTQNPYTGATSTDGQHGHAGWSGIENTPHVHGVDMDTADINHGHGFTTGGRSAFHQHTITVNTATPAAAAQAHENRPPYYALTYIIKVV